MTPEQSNDLKEAARRLEEAAKLLREAADRDLAPNARDMLLAQAQSQISAATAIIAQAATWN